MKVARVGGGGEESIYRTSLDPRPPSEGGWPGVEANIEHAISRVHIMHSWLYVYRGGRTRSRVTHILPSQQKVSHSVAALF